MKHPKDYTSTIMRMAGNIAAGIVTGDSEPGKMSDADVEHLAELSLRIARAIVRRAQE